jgi:hypothetical protein
MQSRSAKHEQKNEKKMGWPPSTRGLRQIWVQRWER